MPPAINRRLNAYLFSTGDTYGENPVEYYYPDRPWPTFPETGQDFSVDSETNRSYPEETHQPSIDPRNIDPIPAPPPPPMNFTQVAPPPTLHLQVGGK